MKLSQFDYYLPEELIAQSPAPSRDQSRLMVIRRDESLVEHKQFRDIMDYLAPGDTLVVNESRVISARLQAKRERTGASIEVLLLKPLSSRRWEVLVRPGKKARMGERLLFDKNLSARIIDHTPAGGRVLEFDLEGPLLEGSLFKEALTEIIEQIGALPLPPYIKQQPQDPSRYQTVFASQPGSVAAPTAGLHFTGDLLTAIKAKGINVVSLLLHVGLGTFRPVQVENIEEHHMHAEYFEITRHAAETIAKSRQEGGRIIAVGTTTTRCLESAAGENGAIAPGSGWTDIFIYPGYRFKAIDGLVTNFHLPRSTLLMMISAFAGRKKVLDAYETAVKLEYRFFSFGDAMLII